MTRHPRGQPVPFAARRKKKVVAKATATSDNKLKSMIKKFNVQPVPDIAEVNMFKSDDTVIHFKHPEGNNLKIQLSD